MFAAGGVETVLITHHTLRTEFILYTLNIGQTELGVIHVETNSSGSLLSPLRTLEEMHSNFMDEKDRSITEIYNQSKERARCVHNPQSVSRMDE